MPVPVPSLFWLNRESKQSRPPRPGERVVQGTPGRMSARVGETGSPWTCDYDAEGQEKSQVPVCRATGRARPRAAEVPGGPGMPGDARAGFGKGRVRTCRAGSNPHHPPAQKSQGGARHLLLWRNGSAGAWPLQRETRCGAFGPRRPPAREDPGSQAVTDVRREPGGSFQRTGVANRAAASCTSR